MQGRKQTWQKNGHKEHGHHVPTWKRMAIPGDQSPDQQDTEHAAVIERESQEIGGGIGKQHEHTAVQKVWSPLRQIRSAREQFAEVERRTEASADRLDDRIAGRDRQLAGSAASVQEQPAHHRQVVVPLDRGVAPRAA